MIESTYYKESKKQKNQKIISVLICVPNHNSPSLIRYQRKPLYSFSNKILSFFAEKKNDFYIISANSHTLTYSFYISVIINMSFDFLSVNVHVFHAILRQNVHTHIHSHIRFILVSL